jgi:hypothetical protein
LHPFLITLLEDEVHREDYIIDAEIVQMFYQSALHLNEQSSQHNKSHSHVCDARTSDGVGVMFGTTPRGHQARILKEKASQRRPFRCAL